MERVVLIGENIGHSASPAIHNLLFERYDLPLRYELMPLEPEELVDSLRQLKRGGFRGANVTSPYKQAVVSELDDIADDAAEIGAVNTIVFEHGRGIGHNTDSCGFAWALKSDHLVSGRFSASVIGTGGAALAAIRELLCFDNLESVVIYSRDVQRAEATISAWDDPRIRGRQLSDFTPSDLVVHATPVGLRGVPGQLLSEEQLEGVQVLFEMNYMPENTPLVQGAIRSGARIITGRRMLIGQAARAFRLWTGIEIDPEEIPASVFDVEVGHS